VSAELGVAVGVVDDNAESEVAVRSGLPVRGSLRGASYQIWGRDNTTQAERFGTARAPALVEVLFELILEKPYEHIVELVVDWWIGCR